MNYLCLSFIPLSGHYIKKVRNSYSGIAHFNKLDIKIIFIMKFRICPQSYDKVKGFISLWNFFSL
jgi:hypothetical protein